MQSAHLIELVNSEKYKELKKVKTIFEKSLNSEVVLENKNDLMENSVDYIEKMQDEIAKTDHTQPENFEDCLNRLEIPKNIDDAKIKLNNQNLWNKIISSIKKLFNISDENNKKELTNSELKSIIENADINSGLKTLGAKILIKGITSKEKK